MPTLRPGYPPARGGRSSAAPRQPEPSAQPPLELHAPDWGYIFALLALVSVGIVMMYSTLPAGADLRDRFKLFGGLAGGLLLLAGATRLELKTVRKLAPLLLLGCFLALLSLKIPGNPVAVTTNGATRWIRLPGGLTLQPSEFAKLAFVLFAASYLEKWTHKLHLSRGNRWGVFLGTLAVFAGMIYKEPDLGTALVLSGTAFCLLLIAGVDWKLLIGGACIAAVLVLFLAWNTGHQKARLLAWWNPWAEEHRQDGGYQVIRSWTAMARGGLTGVGMGQSTMKLDNRLPESETDFVFAIVAEELGLIRAAGVLLLFGLLVWRGYSIAARAPDRYSGLLVAGLTSWVAVQSCLNIAVVTGTVPNTGVPLPFVSSGLSSLTALLAAAGLVINISMRTREGKSAA